MIFELEKCTVRQWRPSDAQSIAKHADNRKIWLNLRDAFPHPYKLEDAQAFIKMAKNMQPETYFCIELQRQAVGGIGFSLRSDVERVSAEIGYWLGEEFWGRGIMTEALRAVTDYAMTAHNLTRIYALPYAYNTASARVLEKAGFTLEGRLRKSVIKDGVVTDQLLYAFIAEN
ncbi:GNAT family N-acetyltransferase [candidate division KSB1 bacterium]|nr:GNAT family N-acetyltransferase [candidate division KSB1 bacterium]RQW02294.1 MAG: N-acetyltransferase [candidate division KSB1 bacterium]